MTTSDPVQLAVDAQHLAVVARHIQAQVDSRIRAVEQASSGLRQVTIISRNPANLSCTVALDGDPSVSLPCRPVGTHVVPIVGLEGWVIQNGTDLVLVGMREAALPKIRCRSTAISGAVTTEVDWAFGVGTVQYDTDGLFFAASGNFHVQWPGTYAFGARTFAAPSAGGIVPVMLIQALGGALYYDAAQDTSVGTNGIHLRAVGERYFNAGEGIQLRVRSAGGSAIFGDTDATHELGTVMWMSYKP